MKGSVISLGHVGERKAAARFLDGLLDDFLVDPADTALPVPGSIFRAICDRPVKGMGGMFVRLPGGGSGFLRQTKGLRPGDPILVQVSGFAEPGKALPVTNRLLFKSRYAIVTPGAPGANVSRAIRDDEARDALHTLAADMFDATENGLILRTQAADADLDAVAADIQAMAEAAAQVATDATGKDPAFLLAGPDAHVQAWRDWPTPDVLRQADDPQAAEDISDALAEVSSPRTDLRGGGITFVESTRALVAVDVNTSGDMGPASGLKASTNAARDLPRQLRCRGLGGQIVVDFAPVPKKDRRQLEQTLKAAFRNDPVDTVLVGWTGLGLYELQRKRERLPVAGVAKS